MEVIKTLSELVSLIYIVTSAPEKIFKSLVGGNVRFRSTRHLDAGGMVQRGPLHVDLLATQQRIESTMSNRESIISEEQQWLQDFGITLVLGDVPFFPIVAANRCGIKSVIISNFLWDEIYSNVDLTLPQISSDYCHATSWLRLRGFLLPPPHRSIPITDIEGLLVTRSTRTRKDVRDQLGVDWDAKLVIIQFGGHDLSGLLDPDAYQRVPPDWVILFCGDVGSTFPHTSNAIHVASGEFEIVDLLNAADALIGKVGYGTVTEVIAEGIPFVYLSRDSFAQQKALLGLLDECCHPTVRLKESQFISGRWAKALHEVLALPSGNHNVPCTGAKEIVKALLE